MDADQAMNAPLLELTIPAGEGAPDTSAVAIVPSGADRGVVVIHEIFGRQPEIDRVVARFAGAGYAAVAPDLFGRGFFTCLRDVFRAMKTGDGVVVQQGRNARAWLCAQAGIHPSRVGLIGFCFGGGYALAAGSGWGAVSANYGHLPSETALRGCGPVIACYGTRDKTLRHAPARLRAQLNAAGRDDFEVHEFDAGHSFITDGKRRLPHRLQPMGFGEYPEAREEAWRRILTFFDRRLGT
jgi:carboxymethylenebutenolidase